MNQQEMSRMIWENLSSKIGNPYGVAGLMGNLFAESALIPNNLENAYKDSLKQTNESYTSQVDSGSYPRENFINDSAGYGLAQWTFPDRKRALLDFAQASGRSIGDLNMQLDYLWKELTESYAPLVQILQSAQSVAEASNAVLTQFERPANMGRLTQLRRTGYGLTYLNFFSPETPEGPVAFEPFKVHLDSELVNIRSGPGTDQPISSTFSGAGDFTIVEVARGPGSDLGWGRLDNGQGWITLDFATDA